MDKSFYYVYENNIKKPLKNLLTNYIKIKLSLNSKLSSSLILEKNNVSYARILHADFTLSCMPLIYTKDERV